MDKVLKLYCVDGGVSGVPFPNSDGQIEIGAFRYDAKRMGGAPTITASVNYPSCLDEVWTEDVYAEFNGEKYFLKQTPTSSYNNESTMYKHDLELVSERVILDNVYFFDAVVGDPQENDKPVSNSTKVVFFGDVREFASRLQSSLEYSGLDYTVAVDDDVTSEEKLMSFEDQFFSNVLQEIYNTYEVPYYFEGKTIRIGYSRAGVTVPEFSYGVDDALLSITKNNANYKIVNRATATGSSENIPFYYPNNSPKGEIRADSSRSGLVIKVINGEDFSNNVKIGGEVRYDALSLSSGGMRYKDQPFASGSTVNIPNLTGGVTATFEFPFTAHNTGTFYLDLDCEIDNIRSPHVYQELPLDTVGYKINIRRYNIRRGEMDTVVKSVESGRISVPIDRADDFIIYVDILLAVKRGDTNISCDLTLTYENENASGWFYDGKEVTLQQLGLAIASGTPTSGDTITQTLVEYINTSQTLLPYKYRETKGAERFYNATNGTYEGVTFNNPFVAGHPKEHIFTVENIKPSIEGMEYNGQRIDMFEAFAYDRDDNDETYEDEEGNVYFKHPYFFAKLKPLGFNLFDHAIEQQPMTISFTSGNCGACNFEIAVDEETQKNTVQVDENGDLVYDENGMVLCGTEGSGQGLVQFQDIQQDTTNNSVWIALRKEEDTYGILMPKAPVDGVGGHRPTTEDTFAILGINLPYEYIIYAEKKVEAEIIKYLQNNNDEKFTFSINLSRIYFAENETVLENLSENSKIAVRYNGKRYELYVSSFSYSMSEGDALPEIRIDLDDTLKVSQNALQNAISQVKSELGRSIRAIDVVGASEPYFIRKDADDEVRGRPNFLKGVKFGEGGKVDILDNNSAKLTIEYLEVTKKATFTSLEIQEKTHVGGQILVTPASINCGEVEEFDDYYRCYFQTKGEDGDEIFNQFVVGDQAICQTFNAWQSKYYWRLVTGVGEDYIDLSKTVCDTDSDIPSAGDRIIQLGSQTETRRQNAIVIAAYGEGSPYIIQYKGINSFDVGDDKIVTKLSSTENIFTGKVHMELGSDGLETLPEWLDLKGVANNAQEAANKAQSAADKAQGTANEALEKVDAMGENTFAELEAYINEVKESLQGQIDGAIDSYFYEYAPTSSNAPASDWDTDAEKEAHLNDTFTNLKDGRSWRWSKDANNNYSWVEITDTATSEALALAGKAQETADGKMTVFMSQPTPPYKAGDLWAGGENAPLKRCIRTKASGAYDASDWALADNAQAYADAIKSELELSISATTGNLEQAIANAEQAAKDYTDEGKKAINKTIEELESAKANVSDVYDKTTVDGKITTAEQNANTKAQELATAAQELAETNVKAWADGEIDAAEKEAIAEAEKKVNAAKGELNEAMAELERDLESQIGNTVATLEQSIASAKEESKGYTDTAKGEINKTIEELESAKANVQDVYDKATTDGKISDAEGRAIVSAKDYANAQRDLLDTTLRAWADGEISDAEANAIAEAQAKVDAAKAEMEKYTDDAIDSIEVGGTNLLRNSGFTGDYLSAQLADEKVIEAVDKMFNPPLIHWESTNASVVESDESSSGFEVVLTNGNLSQELYQKVIANESYVVSFKAKGTSLTLSVGGLTKTIQLTNDWVRYVEKLSTTTTGEIFSVSNANCNLCEVQLERGTIATAWSRSFLDNSSDRAYYQAREYLDAAIKGFTDVYGGLILTGLIKVGTQANGVMTKETAGINGQYLNDKDVAFWAGGSDVQAINAINQAGTNEANFAVSHGGKVVMNDAVVRGKVYASEGEFRGDIYADNGVFGGFIQKKVTMVNSANIDAIAPLEGGYRTLSPKTAGSLMYITDSIIGQITFSLPHLWKGRVYDISENEYTPTDVRAMVGNSITIYNESPNAIVRVCGYALSVGLQGQETMSLGCSVDGIANPKHYCHAECKLKKSDEGYEYIYWELHNGMFE